MATIYYTIKNCVRGWSSLYVNPVDIRKIINIGYSKRLFRVTNRDYMYTLDIEYSNPHTDFNVAPVIGFNNSHGLSGVAMVESYHPSSSVTMRFKTLNDVRAEVDNITRLQNKIKEYDELQNKNISEFVEKENSIQV
jgi:hypothetical protein